MSWNEDDLAMQEKWERLVPWTHLHEEGNILQVAQVGSRAWESRWEE